MPLVSIVIAVYNSEKFLKESIESVLKQDYPNLEILIIDDCSSDSSAAIIKELMCQDQRIKYFYNPENLGPAAARNKGIAMAHGQYIAILDSDDIALPHRISTQVDFLKTHPDIFLAGSDYQTMNQKGQKLKKIKRPKSWETIKKEITRFCPLWNGSIMFKNDQKTFYRDKFYYAQDYDLFLRLATQEKKMANIPLVLTAYRKHLKSISYQHKTRQKLFSLKAKEFYEQRLKNKKDDYDFFNPLTILNANLEESSFNFVLKSEIFASFLLLNKARLKKLCLQYFKHHGYFNKITLYYALSFLPQNFLKFLNSLFLR